MNIQEEEKEQVEQVQEVQSDKKIRDDTPGVYAPKKKFILIGIAVVLILGIAITGGYFLGVKKNQPKACTQEAKICPDGSAVGRTGSNCEFSPCPTPNPTVKTSSWKTYIDQEFKYEFKYPGDYVSIKKIVNQVRLNKGAGYIFEVRTYSSKDPLNTWVQKQKANGGQFPTVNNCWSVSTAKFQNKDAFLIRSNVDDQECQMQVPMDEYIVKSEDTVYQIAFSKDPSDKSTVDQILSTFKFTENNTESSSQSTGKSKVINYNLPSGWQTAKNSSGSFEVGYDPTKYNPNPSNLGIDLNSKSCCFSIFFRPLPYDGGSRHIFIKNQGALKLPNTIEKEYIVSGKSSLFMYNVDFSGSSTAGIVVLNNSQALFVSSQSSDQALIEQVLSTLKFTQ